MKKNIKTLASLLVLLFAFSSATLAQVCIPPINLAGTVDGTNVILTWDNAPGMENAILIDEDFNSYTVGTKLRAAAGTTNWTTWSNYSVNEDAVISNEEAVGTGNSVKFVYGNDVVLKLGGKTSGRYRISFDLFVPTGKDAYFNVLHDFAGTTSTWAMQAYFNITNDGQNSTSTPGFGNVHAGSNNTASFTCVSDQWMGIVLDINIDTDIASFYIDNQLITTWQWSKDSFGENVIGGELDAMNFFPPESTATSTFYIDNLNFEEFTNSYNILRNDAQIATGVYGTDYVDKYLEPGTYIYKLAATCNPLSYSTPTTVVVAPYTCDPVTNLTAQFDNFSSVNLSWTAPATADSTVTYRIHRNGEYLTAVSSLNYTDNVVNSGTYEYCVYADYNNCLSASSCQQVNITSLSCGVPVCTIEDYSETAGFESIIIRTSVVPGAAAYRIYFAPENQPAELFHTLTGTYTGVYTSEGGVMAGEEYCFYIQAVCYLDGDSIISEPSETTCYTVPLVCHAPETINGQVQNGTMNVNLLWSESSNGIAYNVYRDNAEIAHAVESTFYTDNNVPEGAHVYYITSLCTDNSESDHSPEFNVTVNTVGVSENTALNAMLYPNPAGKSINIQASDMKHISVSTLLGQIIYTEEVNSDQVVLNTSSFQNGTYMVIITTESGTAAKRISIIK